MKEKNTGKNKKKGWRINKKEKRSKEERKCKLHVKRLNKLERKIKKQND